MYLYKINTVLQSNHGKKHIQVPSFNISYDPTIEWMPRSCTLMFRKAIRMTQTNQADKYFLQNTCVHIPTKLYTQGYDTQLLL